MTNFIYNSAHLSVKDRLTISNLLGLFQSRLTTKWMQADRAQDKTVHLHLIDVDQPEGLQKWEAETPEARIAVTSDDRSARHPFISRPIRAYGPNGVIVLFNSIAQSLAAPREDTRREPARIRMIGRLETPAPAARVVPPPLARPAQRTVAPTPPLPIPTPATARVAVRWGPPEPVMLPPLTQMPGARIHWRQATQQPEASRPAPPPPPPPASPARLWSEPTTAPLPPLVDMPTTHKPVEIHAPAAPLIGRVNFEKPAEAKPAQPAVDAPTLRPSPPQWRAPEPDEIKTLIDFQALAAFEPELELAAPSPEPQPEAPFVELEPSLESLSAALSEEASETEPAGDDALDWWGTADFEEDLKNSTFGTPSGSLLIHALKAIKASAQASIVEIPGLPAVCVIPARNVYFTSAPAARLESAMTARPEVTWRTCESEEEARRLSGTQQSRQASLEQLSWTACLLAAPADPSGIADRAVRLRRWPPITESRGRSKFIRYATMLSGAQATPRELADITGDPLDEILSFVHACSQMNLLEASGHGKTPLAAVPVRTAGAGILRDMIEQLTPPKL